MAKVNIDATLATTMKAFNSSYSGKAIRDLENGLYLYCYGMIGFPQELQNIMIAQATLLKTTFSAFVFFSTTSMILVGAIVAGKDQLNWKYVKLEDWGTT